jgi:antitoxin (DNA-binding transcriptional repressor) of toxin-antitoxin stability system
MATSAIGVRELKLLAPTLVRRAARGERIVITRYGVPQAQLGPVEPDGATGEAPLSPRMRAWLAERRAFEALGHRTVARHRGRYVAVHRGRVVGSDVDPERLFERIWARLDGATFFIGRVGAPPPVVEMPGFEVG